MTARKEETDMPKRKHKLKTWRSHIKPRELRGIDFTGGVGHPGIGKSDIIKDIAKATGFKMRKMKMPKYKHRSDGDTIPWINFEPDIQSWLDWVHQHDRAHEVAAWVLAADAVLGDTPWQITARAVITPEGCTVNRGWLFPGPKWKLTPE